MIDFDIPTVRKIVNYFRKTSDEPKLLSSAPAQIKSPATRPDGATQATQLAPVGIAADER